MNYSGFLVQVHYQMVVLRKRHDHHHCHNKPPDRKWGCMWMTWCPEDIVQRIWGFWKDSSWGRPLKGSGWAFWIRSYQILFFESRPAEMNWDLKHHKMRRSRRVSIAWLAEAFKNYVSPRVAKDWSQKLINPFVFETIVRQYMNLYLYYYYYYWHQQIDTT